MHLQSLGWDEVEARFQAFRRFRSFSSMVSRMLHLSSVLRHDRRLEPYGRWVSHVSLIVSDADRLVSIAWSEPGGMAWMGEQGFVVSRVDFRNMTSWDEVVVEEHGVVPAVLERLEPEPS
jgi:hypothetical protein